MSNGFCMYKFSLLDTQIMK